MPTDNTTFEATEAAELDALREKRAPLHIDDVADEYRREARTAVRECIDEYLAPLVESVTVEEVYVMGSFATGDATRTFSDLDLRIILDAEFGQTQAEQLNALVRREATRACPTDAPWGYIDPQCYPADSGIEAGEVVL
jgi:predicted nucleotidyltransferase